MLPDSEARKELEELSPLLSGLPKKTPLASPPAGYFEALPVTLLAKVKSAKVVPLTRFPAFRTMAIAAAIAGLIGFGAWFLSDRTVNPPPQVAQVGDGSMQTAISQISDTEMVDFVAHNGTITFDNIDPVAQISDDDVPLVLADVSYQELQQYVDQESVLPNLN